MSAVTAWAINMQSKGSLWMADAQQLLRRRHHAAQGVHRQILHHAGDRGGQCLQIGASSGLGELALGLGGLAIGLRQVGQPIASKLGFRPHSYRVEFRQCRLGLVVLAQEGNALVLLLHHLLRLSLLP